MAAEAQIGMPITSSRRMSQHQQGASHPYASATYDTYGRDEYSATQAQHMQQQPYGRASPMVPSGAPPAISNVRAMGGEVGVANGGEYHGQQQPEQQPSTFWKVLTCRCG